MHAEQAERLPNIHADVRELFRIVGRIRWRLGLERTLLFALRGLMASAIVFAASELVAWVIGASELLIEYAWVAGLPLAISLGWALVRWPSDRQAAIVADRRMLLDERLGTAVELARRPSGRFDRLQIQDAVDRAQTHPGGGTLALDRRVRHEGALAAGLVILAAASILLVNLPQPGALAPDQAVTLTDAAAPPDAIDRSAPQDMPELALADTQPAAQTQSDADLAARVQQEQAERDALDRLSQALGRVSAAQPAADAIERGDFTQAHDQLSTLGEEADQLSDAAKQQLSKALQQAAAQTAANDRQLADRERQAGQALGRNNYLEQRQALNALADQVERSGARTAPPDQLARDAGRLQQQAGGQPQSQQGAGQGQGNRSQTQTNVNDGAPTAVQQPGATGGQQGAGAPGQQGGPGVGTGAGSEALGNQPTRLDSVGQSVEVPTKLGSGPGVRPPTGAEDQTGTDPTAGARSVVELVQAQQTGQVAPEQNLVPGEQRPVVRGYFR